MRRPVGRHILFGLAILLIVIVCLEGITRLWAKYVIANPPAVVPATLGQFDRQLGWSLKPLSRATSERTGYRIEYKINSKGLRDDETTYEKPSSIFRIVIVGDSHTFGYGVPIEKHFSKLIESYLEGVEVINMGVNAFGLDQMLLYLKSEGFRYQPDLVVAYVPHYADHRHMYRERYGKQKPRFRLENGRLMLINSPVPAPSNVSKPSARINDLVTKYSLFYRKISDVLSSPVASNETGRDQNKTSDFMKALFELGEVLVREMRQESLKHGAHFVLVTKMKELHKFCQTEGILSLDVSNALSNRRFALPENLGHMNEAGNGALAWEIARFLQSKGWARTGSYDDDPQI